jgi:RelE toxin of RelE / RelB toxin-antitoxin system
MGFQHSLVGRHRSTLDNYAPWAYSLRMLTVVETLLFQRQWPLYWTEEERGAFAAYIAEHPTAGDVVPESGGIRKVRWARAGLGKSGGVRVIYFTRTAEGEVVLLTLYAKAKTDNLTGQKLKEIRRALED